MQSIVKYVADDGTEFRTAEECLGYEDVIAEVAKVMRALPARPVSDDDYGYLQHRAEVFWPVREALLRIGLRYVKHPPWLQEAIDKPQVVHPSYPGRLIDEMCPTPLNRAWYRIMCVDKQLREWGQPYFADHPPDDAKELP